MLLQVRKKTIERTEVYLQHNNIFLMLFPLFLIRFTGAITHFLLSNFNTRWLLYPF